MPTTATIYPTVAAGSGWTNIDNIKDGDNDFAGYVLGAPPAATTAVSSSAYTGIDAGLFDGDQVVGITVELFADTLRKDCEVTIWLAIGGVLQGSAKTYYKTGAGDDFLITFGGAADDWGGSWDGANIGDIEVLFYVTNVAAGSGINARFEYIRVFAEYLTATPDPFTFVDETDAALSTVYTSNTITLAGIGGGPATATVTGSGATMSKNGAAFASGSVSAADGDEFRLRNTASVVPATAVDSVLDVNNITDTYTITTVAVDTTPDAFAFVDATNTEVSTLTTSNEVTITGINAASDVALTGTAANKMWRKNGGTWGSAAGTVVSGDTVQVRGDSSASYSTGVTCILDIGGVSDTYTITTRAGDAVPDAFAFTDVTGAAVSTQYESNTITVDGTEIATTLTFVESGGTSPEYKINAGAWTAIGPTTIDPGDELTVRHTTPNPGIANLTVTIGGISDTYSVATVGIDSDPNAFAFTDVADAIPNVLYTSNTITLAGMTAAVPVTATVNGTGAEMKVNAGGWVASADVVNGDEITVRITAALAPAVSRSAILSVGATSDSFTVTVRNEPTSIHSTL